MNRVIGAEYAADFSVSRVFADDMVVQRNEHIRVWGFAPESENGKKVSGEFKGLFAESLIENGEWCLTFGEKLDADIKGAQMRIFTDKKEIVFKDVLVGDVYMVIGQSNTEYSVNSHFIYCDPVTQGGGKDAIDPDSLVRLNRNNNSSGGDFTERGTAYVYKDLQNQKQWTKTTVEDTLPFSAIAYFFARDMAERLENKVPVGVIEAGFSGAPLGAFLPNEIAEKYNTTVDAVMTENRLTEAHIKEKCRLLIPKM
jgi:sialate O-acetylesterase